LNITERERHYQQSLNCNIASSRRHGYGNLITSRCQRRLLTLSFGTSRRHQHGGLRIERKTDAIEQKTTSKTTCTTDDEPGLAAVEAGKAHVKDHLAYFSHHLYRAARQTPTQFPRITREDFQDLYMRNQHAKGRHFVVHQHDHPISGSFSHATSQ
jgi:hypothetical protein